MRYNEYEYTNTNNEMSERDLRLMYSFNNQQAPFHKYPQKVGPFPNKYPQQITKSPKTHPNKMKVEGMKEINSTQ
jgi:hypothetical protein